MNHSHRALLRDALRRLAGAVLVLWAAATLTFVGIRLMPGSVEAVVLGTHLNDPGLAEQVRERLGLDQPAIVQYGRYLLELLRGDLGRSYVLSADVSEVVGAQLGDTLRLAFAAVVLAGTLAWVVAVTTAGASRRVQGALHAVELLAICLPTFWVGSLLLLAFSFNLHWFPAVGADGLGSLVLPVVTLALPIAGVLSQFMREEIGVALRQPWVLTVRSRGVSPFRLRALHLVPHAAIASLTVIGNMLGVLIGGAVIVETVFARPGLGRVALTAVSGQDTPVIVAVVLIITGAYVLITTVIDILAVVIDPRLRRVAA
ncbi:MAG: ABC transporter permease [Microbacteriaceae bacterium]